MRFRVPYRRTVEVITYRLQNPLQETADHFGITRQTVINIVKRNPDLVERLKTQIEQEVARESVRPV